MPKFAIIFHLLAAVIWVGGMFFAYMALRPAAATLLEPPQRLNLWVRVFARFFPWVWISIVTLPVTGYGIIFGVAGGMGNVPSYVHIMNGIGTVMILVFLHVYFVPFRRLKRAVAEQNWQEGARQLGQIRMLIAFNLVLGLIVLAVVGGGRYF